MNEKLDINALTPKISVIMSCFNAANFVSEAIGSILGQTFTDFELILIDDGSSDNTLDIIKRYELKDSRVVVIEKQNTGAADSRNWGTLASKGEWIAILDADDIALPTRLEQQFAYTVKNPDVVILGSDFISIDKHGSTMKKYHYPASDFQLKKRQQRNMAFPPHSSFIYRAEVVKRIGGFNTRYVQSEDWDLWFRLEEQGRIACLNKPLVKIRKHSNNISNSDGGRTQALYGIVGTICHFLRSKGVADPSACDNEANWRAFIEWITLRVQQEGYFERQKKWAQMRQAYFSPGNKMSGAWRLTKGLATSRDALRIIHEKFFGSDLPATLADEWIRKCKCPE